MAWPTGAAAGLSADWLAVGPDGTVYFTDGNTVRRLSPDGQVTTLAGQPGYGAGSYQDGPGAQARFDMPAGLAVAPDGTVYVADRGNHLIRRVSATGDVTTLAGQPGVHPLRSGVSPAHVRYAPDATGRMGFTADGDYHDGPAASARFNHPSAVALGADGTLYVANEDNNCIRTIRPSNNQ